MVDAEVEAVAREISRVIYGPANEGVGLFDANEECREESMQAARAAIAALDAVRGARKVQTCPRAPYPFRYCPDCTGGNDCVMTPPPETAP